jgi:hypothetical protein
LLQRATAFKHTKISHPKLKNSNPIQNCHLTIRAHAYIFSSRRTLVSPEAGVFAGMCLDRFFFHMRGPLDPIVFACQKIANDPNASKIFYHRQYANNIGCPIQSNILDAMRVARKPDVPRSSPSQINKRALRAAQGQALKAPLREPKFTPSNTF